MGQGIAPLIKRAFPLAWEADKKTIKGDKSKLGSYSVAVYDGLLIFNLYGQYEYGRGKRQTDYSALKKSLVSMRENIPEKSSIGLPKIGAGLGGGNWQEIEQIIDSVFSDFEVTIYCI